MTSLNPLYLFNNHFVMHRRNYPYRTRLAIAADLEFDGYEFHPIEPDDDKTWNEAAAVAVTVAVCSLACHCSGLRIRHCGRCPVLTAWPP